MKKTNLERMFGKFLCDDKALKKYMGKRTFRTYQSIKYHGGELDQGTASQIANAIKKWAFKLGATHYSHWFMPLTNKTAEMQISFVEITSTGKVIENFSGKDLIKGEADASSFPNGGERMVFESRGYTIWDYTSPIFINEDKFGNKTLYIPTAFCSYNGTALDEKTPLLRATEKLNQESTRLMHLLGYDDVKKVTLFSGVEQEYFLVKTADYEKRLDLKTTGRTLLGSKPLISQEEYSHYFGMIEDNISGFMNEVNRRLWKMGITAKHQHNEAAPMQFEFVSIYSQSNIASDQNQIIMQTIHKTAKEFGFTALFHEKPFAPVNGSGKHVNWSLSTDTGINLFNSKLKDRMLFYTFFIAMVEAIDKYYKLIRLSCAYRSNDLRLGGHEAPPALISMFCGDKLLQQLKNLEEDNLSKDMMDIHVKSLPKFKKDFCDRNRTSPFAFSVNKFEFRMVGSSQSVSFPTTCIATALSEVIKEISDELEKFADKKLAISEILRKRLKKHERIIFNGNGYDPEWKKEAKKRGLVEYNNLLSVYNILDDKDIIKLFTDNEVLNQNEITLRKNTIIKKYLNDVILEANTLLEMLNKTIYPTLINLINSKNVINSSLNTIENNFSKMQKLSTKLSKLISIFDTSDYSNENTLSSDKITETIDKIRDCFDEIEPLLPKSVEPFPTYNDILLND